MKINFIREFNAMMRCGRDNELPVRERMFWIALFYIANDRAVYDESTQSYEWADGFISVSNAELGLYTGMDKRAIAEIRKRLIERGVIDFQAGERKTKAPMYKLNYLTAGEATKENQHHDNTAGAENESVPHYEYSDAEYDNIPDIGDEYAPYEPSLGTEMPPVLGAEMYPNTRTLGAKMYPETASLGTKMHPSSKYSKQDTENKLLPQMEYSADKHIVGAGGRRSSPLPNNNILPFAPKTPTVQEVADYISECGYHEIDAREFIRRCESNGWKDGNGKPIRNWQMYLRGWIERRQCYTRACADVENRRAQNNDTIPTFMNHTQRTYTQEFWDDFKQVSMERMAKYDDPEDDEDDITAPASSAQADVNESADEDMYVPAASDEDASEWNDALENLNQYTINPRYELVHYEYVPPFLDGFEYSDEVGA